MANTNWNTIFGDLFKASQKAYGINNNKKMDIAIQKDKYEENLNAMWRNYCSGVTQKVSEYRKQVDMIKESGCKVLRSSNGKHKIVIQ